MRKTTRFLVLTLAGVVAIAVSSGQAAAVRAGTGAPPKNLKQVGDHWTPWNPPQPAADDYIIQRGDTLWDLAQQWLGNPFLWPQIWDQNRYILDSHWIYPGDPLVRPGKPTVVPPGGPPPSAAGGEDAEAVFPPRVPPVPPPPTALDQRRLIPLATEREAYCADYIDPKHEFSNLWVAGRENEQLGAAQGDVIYLNRGRNAGIEAGMEFAAIRDQRAVAHPKSGEPLGRVVQRLGKVRILCAQESLATAVIVESCDPILDSDEIVPWTEFTVPRVFASPPFERCAEPSGRSGYVVSIKDGMEEGALGAIVHADLAADSGVQPGDFLTIYRDNGELPRILLGQAMVLTVEPGTSTLKVTRSSREFAVGDRVELSR